MQERGRSGASTVGKDAASEKLSRMYRRFPDRLLALADEVIE